MLSLSKKTIRVILIALIALSCKVVDVRAASLKDLRVLGRVIGFIERPPSGDIDIAVVYSSNDPLSKAEADHVMDLLVDGLQTGDRTMWGKLVDIKTTSESDIKFAYLTRGTDTVFDTLASRGVLTLANNFDCIQKSTCVVGAKSDPVVEIRVNKAASELSNITFKSSFRMMVKEF